MYVCVCVCVYKEQIYIYMYIYTDVHIYVRHIFFIHHLSYFCVLAIINNAVSKHGNADIFLS